MNSRLEGDGSPKSGPSGTGPSGTGPSGTVAPESEARGSRSLGSRSLGSRLAEWVSGGLVRVFLIVVGLFWLVPTLGLLLASLRTPQDMAADGWWTVFTEPSQLTFGAYETLLVNDDITGSLLNTVYITVPGRNGRWCTTACPPASPTACRTECRWWSARSWTANGWRAPSPTTRSPASCTWRRRSRWASRWNGPWTTTG
ncbi:hypothetical protein SHIRM173S_08035 [Streptomyces hirsutus]